LAYSLKDANVSFYSWISIIRNFDRVRQTPKAKKAQTFYDWAKEHHPGVILKEWPAVAKIRARHLRSEIERE
jgi:hypothetical protein